MFVIYIYIYIYIYMCVWYIYIFVCVCVCVNLRILTRHFLQIERDGKIGKLPPEEAAQQKVEVLTALKRLGETLSAPEEAFLSSNSTDSLKQFGQVSDKIGKTIF